MCGIVAIFRHPGVEVPDGTLSAMTDMVAHRGPDGWGTDYLSLQPDAAWRVFLGHRRLSILEVSEAGRQPMVYRDHLWLTDNGGAMAEEIEVQIGSYLLHKRTCPAIFEN
jgi:asparagine synthase (glutamine-hydrolysing)